MTAQSKRKGKGKKGKKFGKGSPLAGETQEGEGEEEKAPKRWGASLTIHYARNLETQRTRGCGGMVVSGPLPEKPENATLAFKQGSMGIPVFQRVWQVSDAPIRNNRVLDNPAGDQRLWDPSDEDFWAVCQPVEDEQTLDLHQVLPFRRNMKGADYAQCPRHCPCCWLNHGSTGHDCPSGRAYAHDQA